MAATVKAEFVVQRDDQETFEVPVLAAFKGAVPIIRRHVAGCLEPRTKFVLRKPDGGAAFNTDNDLASYLGTASPPTVVVDIGHTLPFSITGADGVPRSFEVENVQFGMEVCDLKELVGAHLQLGPRDSISMLLLVDPNVIPKDKRADFVKKFCMPASAAAESLQRLKDRAELDEDFFCIFNDSSVNKIFIHSAPASAAAASFSGAQILGAAACPQPDQSAFSSGPVGDVTTRMQELSLRGGRKLVFVRDKYGSESCDTVEFSVGEIGSKLLRRCVARFVPGDFSQLEVFSLTAVGDWRCGCLEQSDGNWILNPSFFLDGDFAAAANKHENYLVLVRSESSPPMQATSFVNIEGIGAQPGKQITQPVNVKAGMPIWDVLSRLRLVFGPSVRSGGEYDLVLPDEILRPPEISDEDWDRFQSLRLLPGATLDRRFLFSKEFIQVFSVPQGNRLKACIHVNVIPTEDPIPLDELFERDASVIKMFQAFQHPTRGRSAPVMGQSFGAGKSVLCNQFREFVSKPGFLAKLQEKIALNGSFNQLMGAVFVGIKFRHGIRPDGKETIEEARKRTLNSKLFEKLGCTTGMPCTTAEQRSLMLSALGRKVLFYFDEIQVFEENKNAGSLYRFWEWARDFVDELGGFYMLSGRSQWLHLMGQSISFSGNPTLPLSRDSLVHIPLPLLSKASIEMVLLKKGLHAEWRKERCVRLLKRFSAGVPRQVALFSLGEELPPTSDDQLLRFLEDYPAKDIKLRNEVALYELSGNAKALWFDLLSAAWARIVLPREAVLSTGGSQQRTLCDAISQVGHYYKELPEGVVVRVPLWAFLVNVPEIAHHLRSAPGDRLENGAMHTFALRLELLRPQNWTAFGLPCLAKQQVPFAFVAVCPKRLPKVLGETKATTEPEAAPAVEEGKGKGKKKKASAGEIAKKEREEHAKQIALAFCSNSRAFASTPISPPDSAASAAVAAFENGKEKWTITLDQVDKLYAVLKIGVVFLFSPMSYSEDGVIRVGKRHLLCLQFKNLKESIDLGGVEEEVKKCHSKNFTVTLLVICTMGHSICGDESDKKDAIIKCGKVTAIVLCRQSVLNFLGLHFVTHAQSGSTYQEAHKAQAPQVPITPQKAGTSASASAAPKKKKAPKKKRVPKKK